MLDLEQLYLVMETTTENCPAEMYNENLCQQSIIAISSQVNYECALKSMLTFENMKCGKVKRSLQDPKRISFKRQRISINNNFIKQ